jgi:hypothetical protein
MPTSDAAIRNGWMPRSNNLVIVAVASLVCSVLRSRCPVCAAPSAMSAVSWSRISPTRMTLGSCRRIDRSPLANVTPARAFTCIWLTPATCTSMGSSRVMMLFVDDLIELSDV